MAECGKDEDAAQPSPLDTNPVKLSELLDYGRRVFEEVDSTNEALGCSSVQAKVRRAISMLEEASRMVSELQLFSRNEDLEEVSTADLRFLLLPAVLGALTAKLSGQDRRLDILRTARTHFMDFLRRCRDYNISQFHLPKSEPEDQPADQDSVLTPVPCSSDLVAMAAHRQAKIERYREKKELEARLSDLQRAVDSGQADDEVSRSFYLLSIRRWVNVCLEEIESIDQEVPILKGMSFRRQGAREQRFQPATTHMKPFILTRDAAQAQVFGAGYPSLPTMTVNEWYDDHRKRGALPDQGIASRNPVQEDLDSKEQEEEEKEAKADDDDEESLLKARNWDDWKDTHRRGYGNRQNMG